MSLTCGSHAAAPPICACGVWMSIGAPLSGSSLSEVCHNRIAMSAGNRSAAYTGMGSRVVGVLGPVADSASWEYKYRPCAPFSRHFRLHCLAPQPRFTLPQRLPPPPFHLSPQDRAPSQWPPLGAAPLCSIVRMPPPSPPLGAPLLCSLPASPSAASLSSGLRRISSFEALLVVAGGCWCRFEYRGSLWSPRSRLIVHRNAHRRPRRPVPWNGSSPSRTKVTRCSFVPLSPSC
jgi:hypothetical protein